MALGSLLERFAASGHGRTDLVREIEHLILDLSPFVSSGTVSNCFLHNELHELNIMCSSEGELLALIDWGTPVGVTQRSISLLFRLSSFPLHLTATVPEND
jgi:aminoglycoside phosphotransferase (APT) family kinase protein